MDDKGFYPQINTDFTDFIDLIVSMFSADLPRLTEHVPAIVGGYA